MKLEFNESFRWPVNCNLMISNQLIAVIHDGCCCTQGPNLRLAGPASVLGPKIRPVEHYLVSYLLEAIRASLFAPQLDDLIIKGNQHHVAFTYCGRLILSLNKAHIFIESTSGNISLSYFSFILLIFLSHI